MTITNRIGVALPLCRHCMRLQVNSNAVHQSLKHLNSRRVLAGHWFYLFIIEVLHEIHSSK